MRKIRYFFAAAMLMASLSGFTFLGLGSGSLAMLASNSYTSTHAVAIIRYGYCPGQTTNDC